MRIIRRDETKEDVYLLDSFDFIKVALRVNVRVTRWKALANHDSRQECSIMRE